MTHLSPILDIDLAARYLVEREFARGGMVTVYLAWETLEALARLSRQRAPPAARAQ